MKNIQNIRLCYKDFLTLDFLEKEYVQNRKSISQLARELNIHEQTITRYLRTNNISVRSILEQAKTSSKGGEYKYKHFLTKDFLEENYLVKQKSIIDLAEEFKLDCGTIVRYLKMYNIQIRSCKEQIRIKYPTKTFLVTHELNAFIEGLMLGDASIPKRVDDSPSRYFTQGCKYKEYLEYISKRLSESNISCSPILSRWLDDARCKNKGYHESFLQTHSFGTFEEFRERWYPNGKKIIPRDVVITNDLLLQLYLCDGNYYRHILLCTNGFSKEDVLFLKNLIEMELQIVIRLIDGKDGFMLAINKSDCNIFLDYIGPCPVKCYGYKWKDNESQEAKIRKNINARISYRRRQNEKRHNICDSSSLF